MKTKNENYEEPRFDDVVFESDVDEFEIGQCYEDTPAKKLVCRKCGGDEWFVGSSSHYTAIKCPVCLFELCIHSG